MNIVILNGWAMPSSIWNEFCNSLTANICYENCQIIDIDRSLSVDQWVRYFDENIESDTLLIGWSLGGMLALEYAYQHPAKIRGLCLLQVNPKFVADNDWLSAMAPEEFEGFKQLATSDEKADVRKLIKQFSFLVTAKGLDAIEDLRALKRCFSVHSMPAPDVMIQSLELLESLDVRDRISTLQVPQLHIFSEYDQLVPCSAAQQVKELNSLIRVELIGGVSHFPCYSAAERIVTPLADFAGGLN